jgi:hypothetical protein
LAERFLSPKGERCNAARSLGSVDPAGGVRVMTWNGENLFPPGVTFGVTDKPVDFGACCLH